jgi:hypothetical protein
LVLGNPESEFSAAGITPAHVERVLRDAGFRIEGTEVMLPGITMLTRAVKAD